jgi:hypothetical protein
MDDTNLVALESHSLDSEGSDHVEIEVVDEIPPQNFNPPLTGPFDPIHFLVILFHTLSILTQC